MLRSHTGGIRRSLVRSSATPAISGEATPSAAVPEASLADLPVRVLVVEDNPGDFRLIQIALEEAQDLALELVPVASLAAARRALPQGGFDLVLLDLYLPDSQGIATLNELARVAPGLPLIVLTGQSGGSIELDSLGRGADDFLHKEEIGGGALARSIRYALERQRRSRHEQFLGHVLTAISGILDAEAALRTVAHLAVPAVADWCVVELLEADQVIRVLEIVASHPRKQTLLRAKLASYPHSPTGGRHPTDQVLRTGEARLLARVSDQDLRQIARDILHLKMLRELDPRSMMIVPLTVEGRVLGAITCTASESGRQYDGEDLRRVQEVARGAAMIVENARRFERVTREKQSADEAAEQVRRTERVSSALAAATTPQQVAAAVMHESMQLIDASAGALLVRQDDGAVLDLLRSTALPESALPLWSRLSTDEASPIAYALRTGEPVLVPDRAELIQRYPDFAARAGSDLSGLLAIPLTAEERVLGSLVLLFPQTRAPARAEEQLLESFASKCAHALQRAFLYEREQRALAEAHRASRLKDEVLSVVAHDLRNPMSAIGTYASLLEKADADAQQRTRWARAVHSLTEQVQKLIQELLDVSKIESGTLALEVSSVDAERLLQDGVELMEPVAAAAGLRIHHERVGGLPRVSADADRVRQVFSNLLGNAIKFSPRGGEISVRVESLGSEVLYLVSDGGPGIPLEDRPHLFDRFWQARRSRAGGSGLGLAIAKGIVERHGGRIGVESRSGAGSTFFFTLPCSDLEQPFASPVDAADDRAEEIPRAPGAEGGGVGRAPPVRVLIVDDHPLVRRGVREQLERTEDFEIVAEAATGEEAVQLARLARPDLVLMDLHLPGLSGVEATRQITTESGEVSVLALSAETESDVLLPVLEAGGSGFVRKSSAEHDLLAAVEAVLQGEVFLYPSGNKLLLGAFRSHSDDAGRNPANVLSEHERQVLALAAEGFTATEIGRRLFLSPKTVESYRSRAMRKLGLGSRPDLVRFAIRNGLLSQPEKP